MFLLICEESPSKNPILQIRHPVPPRIQILQMTLTKVGAIVMDTDLLLGTVIVIPDLEGARSRKPDPTWTSFPVENGTSFYHHHGISHQGWTAIVLLTRH